MCVLYIHVDRSAHLLPVYCMYIRLYIHVQKKKCSHRQEVTARDERVVSTHPQHPPTRARIIDVGVRRTPQGSTDPARGVGQRARVGEERPAWSGRKDLQWLESHGRVPTLPARIGGLAGEWGGYTG